MIQKYKYEPDAGMYQEAMWTFEYKQRAFEKARLLLWEAEEMALDHDDGRSLTRGTFMFDSGNGK